MQFPLNYIFLVLLILISSCAKEQKKKISAIEEKSLELQMIEAYSQGVKELERGDVIYAAKRFNEAELLYPQSIWAPRANLMAAYSYYTQLYYSDAILELESFLEKYPNHPRTNYVYYLLALCHYNQIVDETKDLLEILKAKKYFCYRSKW